MRATTMTESRYLIDRVAKTSRRKLLAFQLKNIAVLKLIHAIFRMVPTLSFVTCIESWGKFREEKYAVAITIPVAEGRAAAPKCAELR
jgi:hypothetical protein